MQYVPAPYGVNDSKLNSLYTSYCLDHFLLGTDVTAYKLTDLEE